MEKFKKQAILYALGIIGIFGGTTALILIDILNIGAYALAALACYPLVKNLWQFAGYMHRNTIRILHKALPKAGFSIEDTEWDEKHTAVRFHGKYQGDNFMIEASYSSAYIFIYDMPWHGIKSSDPMVAKILEAINEVNSDTSNMSVILGEPNNEGIRQIYTKCTTILPTAKPDRYLDILMCDMLNRKPALAEAIKKERPYMTQRRSTVGFNVPNPTPYENAEDCAPAAKNDKNMDD